MSRPTVHVARHAQSVYNRYRLKSFDSPLTTEGQRQAAALLSGHYDLVIVSTLRRARQTLDYSHVTYDRRILSHLCREQRNSIADFMMYEDTRYLESLDSVRTRTRKFEDFVSNLTEQYPRILIISHGVFVWEWVGRALKNCELLDISNRF